jgi:hypothetical protein
VPLGQTLRPKAAFGEADVEAELVVVPHANHKRTRSRQYKIYIAAYVSAGHRPRSHGVTIVRIRDPRTKPSYASWFSGKLTTQNSWINQIRLFFTLTWSNTAV